MSTPTGAVGLPTVTLPPYPTIPGVSPTKVALAVVIVLGRALQSALSGPVPNPIAIPIYMVLIAAYQRLTEIALNHVPVAGTPSTPLQLLTGTVIGDIGTATDPDGDPLRYTVTTQPTKGTVALVGTSYVYTPNALLSRDGGADNFTVTIDDLQGAVDHPYAPNGHTTTETVNINYIGTGIDLPPVPTATQGPRDAIGVVRGGFTVIDLDDLTGAGRTFSLANGNTPGATATSSYTSLGGIVSINQTTGDWTYVPAVSGNLLGIPTHTDTFVVTVYDGHPGGAVQTTVTVGADLGIATTGVSTNATSGVVTGGLNIPTSDNGLLAYAVGGTAPGKGTLFVNSSTGSFIYQPSDAARHAASSLTATDADKIDTFTIKGTDANGRSITVATVQVNILPQNSAPTGTASFGTPNGSGVIAGSVSVTDADSDTLSYSGSAGKGTVTFTGSNFTYTPTLTARHAAAADGASTATKQDTVNITVSDGHGGTQTFSQTVNITPQNTTPTYTSVTKSSSGLLNLTKTWTVNGMNDADGDTLTLAVTSLPSGGLLNVPVVLGNTVTLVSVLAETGKTFVVTMSDGYGGNVPITLTI